jgi:hypothetical protein
LVARRFIVKKLGWLFILSIVLSACASTGMEAKIKKYTPIQENLTYLTQKVEGYYGKNGITKDFNEMQYMKALEEVCYPFPSCKARVGDILNSYELKARSVDDGIITVMLCDKDSHNKVMEDFSCNNSMVEVRTWEKETFEKCDFEIQWVDVINTYCKKN